MKHHFYCFSLIALICATSTFAQDEDQWEYHLSNAFLSYHATYGDTIWFGSAGGVIKVNKNTLEASRLTKLNSDVHIRQVELIDIQGKVLRTWGGGKSTYDIGKFDNGIYILE